MCTTRNHAYYLDLTDSSLGSVEAVISSMQQYSFHGLEAVHYASEAVQHAFEAF